MRLAAASVPKVCYSSFYSSGFYSYIKGPSGSVAKCGLLGYTAAGPVTGLKSMLSWSRERLFVCGELLFSFAEMVVFVCSMRAPLLLVFLFRIMSLLDSAGERIAAVYETFLVLGYPSLLS